MQQEIWLLLRNFIGLVCLAIRFVLEGTGARWQNQQFEIDTDAWERKIRKLKSL